MTSDAITLNLEFSILNSVECLLLILLVDMIPASFKIPFRYMNSLTDYIYNLLVRPRTELISQHGRVRLTPSMIPDASNFDTKDSSFFDKWTQLPSSQQVREKAKEQWASGTSLDKRRAFSYGERHIRPPPAVFEDMDLVVKWGVEVEIAEAQSVYAVNRFLNGRVPVPEIYGWRTDGDEKFLYMQYVHGQTLEEAWDSLEHNERDTVCRQLRTICDSLRQLEQDPSDTFIGLHRR